MNNSCFLTFLATLTLLVCGCSTPSQFTLANTHQLLRNVEPGSILLNNHTPYTLFVNEDGPLVGPEQSIILTDCATGGITNITLSVKAYRLGQAGCILTKDYKGSTAATVAIGPASPPVAVTVSTWNLR